MPSKTTGGKTSNVAIEELIPDDWFLACVNRAYGLAFMLQEPSRSWSSLLPSEARSPFYAASWAQIRKEGYAFRKAERIGRLVED